MKALLIDPYAETITEVEHNGDYREIYKLIDCSTFDVVSLENNDAIYVDDEGLLTLTPETKFFSVAGFHSPLAGKGLVLGTDDEGDSTSPQTTLEEITKRVKFYNMLQIQRMYRS